MTGKDRILRTLRRESHDRVPFVPNLWQWFYNHKYQGTLPTALGGCDTYIDALRAMEADIIHKLAGLETYSVRDCHYESWFEGPTPRIPAVTERLLFSGGTVFKEKWSTPHGDLTHEWTYREIDGTAVETGRILGDDDFTAHYEAVRYWLQHREISIDFERFRRGIQEVGEDGLVPVYLSSTPLKQMLNALMLDADRSRFLLISKILEDDPKRKFHLDLAIPSDRKRLNSGDWHHYAFTYTAAQRQLRHYVDGKLQPLPDQGGFLPMMSRIAKVIIDNNLHGVLDEMRISDVVRYGGDFPLPDTFSRNYAARPRETNKPNGPPLLFDPKNPISGSLPLMSRKHVFIDDALIEKMWNVVFTVNPPNAYEVTTFRNDKPWEPTPRMGSTIPDMCSFWDEGHEIRMLYTNSGMWGGKPHAVCYATSTDGINWRKPVLDLKSWGGSTKNNIVLTNACQGSVIKDPNPAASAGERYKYACWHMYWGYYVHTSPDGIHWRRNETCSLPIDPDGSTSFYWDDQRGLYRGYVRAAFDTGHRRRTAQITMAEFLKPWPFKKVELPDLGDMVLARPVSGELPLIDTGGQVYRFKAHKYPWAPDTYVAFPWRYIADENIRPGSFLMVSRDGVNWKRYEPPYYFSCGWELDGREVTEALMEHGMVRRGDEIWQYGTVRFTVHGGVLYGGEEREGGIYDRLLRLKQRLDGFVSLDAGDRVGTVVTKPLVFQGNKLVLNISANGLARVALLDEHGRTIPGFAIGDCDPIVADSVRHVVTWANNTDVSSVSDKVVKLKFELQNVKLYAFQFTTAD